MDVSEYRKQYQEELERAAEEKKKYRDFLDKSKSVSDRLMAFESAPGSQELDEVAQSINIIRDKNEDTQLRISALDGISIEIAQRHDLIDMVLDLLRDDTEPVALRKAALAVLEQASFSATVFSPKRPEYLAVLRSLIDDADAKLRQRAMEVLASEKDEYLQRRLIEGLQDPAKALIPPEKAIQLLGYDIHAEHYPFLREMINNPPNAAAKQEAVRLLAADPTSKDLLADILMDKGEDREVRKISAVALQSLAPAEFEDHAKQIVLDDDEDDDLRATSMSALDHFADQESLRQDSVFNEAVEQLQERPKSKELERVVDKYVEKRKN
jgi:hypothetical protein